METLKLLGEYNYYIRRNVLKVDKPPIFWKNILQSSRFGEALRIVQDRLNSKNFYAFNPGFDRCEDCNECNN